MCYLDLSRIHHKYILVLFQNIGIHQLRFCLYLRNVQDELFQYYNHLELNKDNFCSNLYFKINCFANICTYLSVIYPFMSHDYSEVCV